MSVTVSGIMINPVGEPVVNAQITLTAVANSLTVLNTFSVTVRTDNTGAYRIQLEEGSYSITVAANGRSFVYGAVTLDDTTGPSTLNQLLKQQIMESELTPDVILYFRQIQQQVANDLATIKVLENSASNSAISAGHSRDEARQYASDLSDALALAKGYRDTAVDSATTAAESAAHALESESIVIANANAAALSEANALQYKNYAQSAADEASTLAAEQTATKIKLAVKTDADRAEAAREDAETAQSAVDTQADEVNRLHTEVGQLALSAAGSSNSAAQSATESESSKNAAAQSKQAAVAAASVAENSATAAAGFRGDAELFAARAKASAESIDVSVLEKQINEKVSQTVFDLALANKLTIQSTFLSTDLNLAITSGIYHPTAAALNLPLQALGVMEVYVRQGGTSLVQIFHATVMTVGNTNRHFVRIGTLSGGVWSFSTWAEQYTSLTMAQLGIGLPNQSDIANFDWQNFAFASGANYVTSYNSWINPPAGVTYNAGTRVSIRVIYISSVNGSRMGLELTPDTGADANFKVYKLLCVGAPGARVFTFRKIQNSAIAVPISEGGTGETTIEGARSVLGGGLPLLHSYQSDTRDHIEAGEAPQDGLELSRALFPEAWATIQAKRTVITDAEWLADPLKRGFFSSGNGTTTFRIPDKNGKYAGSLGATVGRGDGLNSAGTVGFIQADAMRAHTHGVPVKWNSSAGSSVDGFAEMGSSNASGGSNINTAYFGANETRVLNVTTCWVIKLAGSAFNEGQINALELATQITLLATRVTSLEGHQKFTYLYPGGSAAAPATLGLSQRIVLDNPFTGRKIDYRCEVQFGGIWGVAGFGSNVGSGSVSVGALAIPWGDNIVVWSGNTWVAHVAAMTANSFPSASTLTSVPYRVAVWTIDGLGA